MQLSTTQRNFVYFIHLNELSVAQRSLVQLSAAQGYSVQLAQPSASQAHLKRISGETHRNSTSSAHLKRI